MAGLLLRDLDALEGDFDFDFDGDLDLDLAATSGPGDAPSLASPLLLLLDLLFLAALPPRGLPPLPPLLRLGERERARRGGDRLRTYLRSLSRSLQRSTKGFNL